jgi:hypothetical protein
MRTFIPFNKAAGREVIVVDGMHAKGPVLSHWKGANMHSSIADDTSAGIVLNAIKAGFPGLDIPFVTATHFDIDGLIGVWALFYPGLALEHVPLLKEVAKIGDFREYDKRSPYSDHALKLVCWIDTVERDKFYRPFGTEDMEQNEIIMCEEKFRFFLDAFGDVLVNTEKYRSVWENDYNKIKTSLHVIEGKDTCVQKLLHLGLTIVQTPAPLPYYALFAPSSGTDIVLSMYSGQRYELEYKYTTWVDIVSRPTLPRISLQRLADRLNALEGSGFRWYCDKITDTGPILRLENSGLTKAQRFASPEERTIFSSSISPESMQQEVVAFLQEGSRNIQPKTGWTWEEMRSINSIVMNEPGTEDIGPSTEGSTDAWKNLFDKQ